MSSVPAPAPGVVVAPNPLAQQQAAASHASDSRFSRVSMIQQRAAAGALNVTNAVKERPKQSGAVFLSGCSVFFIIIAILAPWWHFSTGKLGDPPDLYKQYGHVTLFEYRSCTAFDNPSSSPYSAEVGCTLAELRFCASAINYMYHAGATSFSFLLFALISGSIAAYATYLLRVGRLENLPYLLRYLKLRNAIPIIHGVTALFDMIAFAVWAGLYNSNFGNDTLKAFAGALVFFFADERDTGASKRPEAQSASGAFQAAAISAGAAYDATTTPSQAGMQGPSNAAYSTSAAPNPYDSHMTDVKI